MDEVEHAQSEDEDAAFVARLLRILEPPDDRPVERADLAEHSERRLRIAWLAGRIEEWEERTGRTPTDAELRQMIAPYPSLEPR